MQYKTYRSNRIQKHNERMRFMKKTLMKKAIAAVTAFMTASTMSVSMSALAAKTDDLNSGNAIVLTGSASTVTIPIKKDIVAFNSGGLEIHEPNIIYTYDVSAANPESAKIRTKDSNDQPLEIEVNKGVLNAVRAIGDSGNTSATMVSDETKKTGTVTFGTDNSENAKKTGNKENADIINVSDSYKFTKQLNLTIDANWIYNPTDGTTGVDNQVNAPGVYRYRIDDVTLADTFKDAGVEDGGAGNSLFLDVYTKYNTDQDGLLIYGYVLFREDTSKDSTTIEYNSNTTPTEEVKTTGFVTDSEGDDDGNGTLVDLDDAHFDKYKTYNVTVKKSVAGDLADRHHKFPFELDLTNTVIKSLADFTIIDTEGTKVEYNLDADGNCVSNGLKLQHGEQVTLVGLPANTFIMVNETNDKEDVYTVSAKINGTATSLIKDNDASTANNSIALDHNETASLKNAYEFKTKGSTDVIEVTNTLSDVSVTGLLFSIAPFIIITLTGAVLLVYVIKSKKSKKNNSVI
jgi:hypothetical protein